MFVAEFLIVYPLSKVPDLGTISAFSSFFLRCELVFKKKIKTSVRKQLFEKTASVMWIRVSSPNVDGSSASPAAPSNHHRTKKYQISTR